MVDTNATMLKESAHAIQNAINDPKVKIIPVQGSVGTAAEAQRFDLLVVKA
jgi:hypothetical protein